MRWGEALEYTAEAGPGDFIYIPPWVPHQEINASRDETLECVLPQRRRGDRRQPDIEPVERPETVRWIDLTHPSRMNEDACSPSSTSRSSLAGSSEDAAIRDTPALAEDCERLGYSRFWLSEHHGLPTIVGSAPEILMAAIAARTSTIRIGSAGVMLPHYSALKVAEQFCVPGRRAGAGPDRPRRRPAPAATCERARALNPNAAVAAEDFPIQVRDLHAWTSRGTHEGITAHPLGPHAPEIWILGSSDYGAQLAAHFGLPYAFAYFFTDGQGAEQAMALYRARYQPSERHPQPQATLCIWALAAETDELAAHLALSRDRWRIDRQRGALGPLQSPDAIAERGFSDAERAMLAPMRGKAFVGSAKTVGAKLRRLADEFALDEVVINTWAHDPAVRRMPKGRRIEVPTGMLLAPQDIVLPPPDSWIRRSYNLVHRRDADVGGHFLAFQRPALVIEDVRGFFRRLRQ